MASRKLGPWPLGIDNQSPDTSVPGESLRIARNVLIQADGSISTAGLPVIRFPGSGIHSLWSAPDGSAYCVQGSNLCQVDAAGITVLAELAGPERVAFCELNGGIVVASRAQLSILLNGVLQPMALDTPSISARAAQVGGLHAGRYGVAISLRKGGAESGLSRMLMIDVPDGGGISLDIPTTDADNASIYRTDANGAGLYRAADGPVGMPGFLVGAGQLGSMAGTAGLEPLPGGHIVQAWMGRLLVAVGRSLLMSAPLRYGLHNPVIDQIRLASRIRMVAPVLDGIYLSDGLRVYLLAGTDPDLLTLRPLDNCPPPIGAFTVVDGSQFKDVPAVPVACWLSEKGFVLGLPEGQLVLAQEKRIRLPMPDQGWLVTDGRRLFAGG